MLKFSIFILIAFTFQPAFGQTENQIENLKAFAKVYGYVKYFHPSDEASQIDWNKFSIYGANKIENCKSKKELIRTLYDLFNPIAPSIKFHSSDSKLNYNLRIITPDNTKKYRVTFWQHQGVGFDMRPLDDTYKSIRVNRDNNSGTKLFDYQPEFGTIITKKLSKGIYCQFPEVLYCNDRNTFPKADSSLLNNLKNELEKCKINAENIYLRLGNIINTYNVFQNFYPYFDVVPVDWQEELENALLRCYTDKTSNDHLITLQKFTAPLKDGHISVLKPLGNIYYAPPISWEWIENQLVVTNIYDSIIQIKVGDIITHIDGQTSDEYFKEIYSRISAASVGWLNFRAKTLGLFGDKDSKFLVTIENKSIELRRNRLLMSNIESTDYNRASYIKIDDNIYYLNLNLIKMDTIIKLLPQLEKSTAIICDIRAYPNHNHEFIQYLLKSDDTTKAWMQVPQIVFPDHDNMIGYKKYNWMDEMKAKKPYLGDKIIVFIISGRTISYGESFMGYIEGYKLATIVGQPTAGTNGNINKFILPGGYIIYFTGMKVLKHNGSQHHGIGILPDIYVNKTIQGIKEGRDEFLEKAIEYIKKN